MVAKGDTAMKYLSGDLIPQYKFSSYRFFEKGEHHVERFCNDDVLLLVFDGTLRFSENGIPKAVSGGEFYIQEKGLYQSGDEVSDSPEYYYVHFVGTITEGERGYLGINGSFDKRLIAELVKKLETAKTSNAPALELHNCFLSIISALSLGANKRNSDFSYKIYHYVNQNLKSDLTLEELSREFGYCKNYVIKLFKNEFNLTPHEYITLRRLDLAKNLLISSNMSTAEIAEECGFVTYVNFYKAFVKREGCTPNEFKIRMRAQALITP